MVKMREVVKWRLENKASVKTTDQDGADKSCQEDHSKDRVMNIEMTNEQ